MTENRTPNNQTQSTISTSDSHIGGFNEHRCDALLYLSKERVKHLYGIVYLNNMWSDCWDTNANGLYGQAMVTGG